MPVEISKIMNRKHRVVVPFDSERLNVVYRPYSANIERKALEKTDGRWDNASLVYLLNQILIEWDLQDEDGQPYATTIEALEVLPTTLLMQVFQSIAEAMKPKAEKEKAELKPLHAE